MLRLERLTAPLSSSSSTTEQSLSDQTDRRVLRNGLSTHTRPTGGGSASAFALRRGEEGVFERGVDAAAKRMIAEVEEEEQQKQQQQQIDQSHHSFSYVPSREVNTGPVMASFGETYVPSSKERHALRGDVGHLAAQEMCLPRHTLADPTAELNLKKSRQLDELLGCPMPALAKAEEVCALLPDFYTNQLALPPRSAELVMALLSQTSLQLRVRRVVPSSSLSPSSLLVLQHDSSNSDSLLTSPSLPRLSQRHDRARRTSQKRVNAIQTRETNVMEGVRRANRIDERSETEYGDAAEDAANDDDDDVDDITRRPFSSSNNTNASSMLRARSHPSRKESRTRANTHTENSSIRKNTSSMHVAATAHTGSPFTVDTSHMEGIPFLSAMRTLYAHQKVCFVAPTALTLEHMMIALASVTAKSTAVFHLAQRLLLDADKYVTLPTRTLYTAYFKICATNDAMSFAVARMRDAVLQLGISLDAGMATALLHGLNERGYAEEAVALLARVQHVPLTTPLLNAALETLLLSGQPRSCFSVLRAVDSASVLLNADSYALLLLACEQMGEWEGVTEILADMQRRRVKGNAQTLNLLLKGLLKQKLYSYAAQLHGTMRVKKVPVWSELDEHVARLQGARDGGGARKDSSRRVERGTHAMLPHSRRPARPSPERRHA